jgi:hypothetical protein
VESGRKSFFFSTNQRDPKFFDIYEMTVAEMTPRLIYQDESGYEFGDISNDKRFIAFRKNGTSIRTPMFISSTSRRRS